jgi:hypothetical protein
MRSEWHKVNGQNYTGSPLCPTCGQDLPELKIKDSIARFNQQKAEHLADISAKGKQSADNVKAREQDILAATEKISTARARIADITREILGLNETLKGIVAEPTPEQRVEIEVFQKLRAEVADEIRSIKDSSMTMVAGIKGAIDELDRQFADIATREAEIRAAETSVRRIEELKAQETTLANEFERLEYELHLLDRFTEIKVSRLESQINAKFKLARFKLFDTQVNGGLAECCETIFDGVPWSRGLNNAARINVGLDIIRTLSAHYGVSAPVFIDNAESVTSLIEIDSQVVRLVVDETAKTLEQRTATTQAAA